MHTYIRMYVRTYVTHHAITHDSPFQSRPNFRSTVFVLCCLIQHGDDLEHTQHQQLIRTFPNSSTSQSLLLCFIGHLPIPVPKPSNHGFLQFCPSLGFLLSVITNLLFFSFPICWSTFSLRLPLASLHSHFHPCTSLPFQRTLPIGVSW